MTASGLRALLDATLEGSAPHVEKMTIAAAVVSEVLRLRGLQTTLVGGGAIEFHASDVYTTTDLDLIVEGPRDTLDSALTEFGFVRRGRHWAMGELFVEVPGNWMSDPVDIVRVGSLMLRVVRREIVLADRIIGFKHWRTTAYGAQAIALLSLFGESLDEGLLRDRLRVDGAEDALRPLRDLAAEGGMVDEDVLQRVLRRLHQTTNEEREDA